MLKIVSSPSQVAKSETWIDTVKLIMIIDLKCLILLIWYKNSHKILEKLMKRDTYIEWNIWQFKIELMIHGLYMLSVKKYLLDVPYLARDKYLINLESSVPTEQDSLCQRNIHVPMYWVPWYTCSNPWLINMSLCMCHCSEYYIIISLIFIRK